MENDIIVAINAMRAKLDEIEKMVNDLPGEMPRTHMTSDHAIEISKTALEVLLVRDRLDVAEAGDE